MPRYGRLPACPWARAVMALALLATARPALAQREAERLSESFRRAAEKVLPSVVAVRGGDVLVPGAPAPIPLPPFVPRAIPGLARPRLEVARAQGGSGFVVDAARGLVLTCEPVLAGSAQASIVLADGREVPVERVVRDPSTSLVLLTVDPGGLRATAVEWGDSEALRLGDWVLALGRPTPAASSVSAGIVGGRGSDQAAGDDRAIRTDAVIDAGNTGGPLIDLDGKVVGVNLSLNGPGGRAGGFGFALPAAHARRIVDELAGFGQVRRGYLGVVVEPSPIGPGDRGAAPAGLVITSVAPGSPAADAGLRVGDRIIALENQPVRDVEALSRAVEQAPVGQEFRLTIERSGRRQEVVVRSRARPEPAGVGGGPVVPRLPGASRRLRPQERPRGLSTRPQAPRPPAPIQSEPEDRPPSASPEPAPGTEAEPSTSPELDAPDPSATQPGTTPRTP